jgi:hypothetical protein
MAESPTAHTLLEGASFLVRRVANFIPADDATLRDLYLACDAIEHVLYPDERRCLEGAQIVLRQQQEREAARAARREATDG